MNVTGNPPNINVAQTPPLQANASSGLAARNLEAGGQASNNASPAHVTAGDKDFQQALKDVQSAISKVSSGLEFSYDQDFDKTIVKVVDSATDEVIRQIPSEEFLRMSKALDKLQGLLIKQEA